MAVAAGRPPAGRLAGRPAAGRDLGADVLGRDVDDLVREVVDLGLELEPELESAMVSDLALDAVLRDLALLARAFVAGLVADVVVRRAAVLGFATALRAGAAASGRAEDIFLAASVRALAAVIMALVAVFIDCMAVDIVLADAVALVAAAVILVAADVTLVAADETFLAAVTDVPELRLAVPRLAVARLAEVPRGAVVRDAVDRDAVLRLDREAVPRVDGVEAVLRDDRAAVLRVVLGLALDDALVDLELELCFGRLAVPLDALRLTDLLRAVLAELRRVAARVVD